MFGINGGELLILIVVAIIVVGPERMPEYARQLREWVKALRLMVDQGRNQLKEEVGDDVDWSKLDPRQYDPRHIVREAFNEPVQGSNAGGAQATNTAAATGASVSANARATATGTSTAGAAGHQGAMPTEGAPGTPLSTPAPFDSEAT